MFPFSFGVEVTHTNKYEYKGPVISSDFVTYSWSGETYAISEKRAIMSLKYHFRKDHGLKLNHKIYFPGTIRIVKEDN